MQQDKESPFLKREKLPQSELKLSSMKGFRRDFDHLE